jgi:hypothetical protein
MIEEPQETGWAKVDAGQIALSVWMLMNHPQWRSHIKQRVFNSNYENAHELHEWLSMTFTQEVSEKLQRKLQRELDDVEAFTKRYMIVFNSWSNETRDAVCRAALHDSDGVSLEKPRMILTP